DMELPPWASYQGDEGVGSRAYAPTPYDSTSRLRGRTLHSGISIQLMSQMGHSRPDCAVRVMSGLAPIAAGERTCRFGSFVPQPDSCIAAKRPLHSITSSARPSSGSGIVR